MSEIEKRRKVRGSNSLIGIRYAEYKIDAELFEKDGDTIRLPDPEDITTDKNGDWATVTLVRDIKPWTTDTLYETIRRLGYFAFVVVETFDYVDKNNCRSLDRYYNLYITDEKSFTYVRDESIDGSGTSLGSPTRYALLFFDYSESFKDGQQIGKSCSGYDGRDIFGNEIGTNVGYDYQILKDTIGIDAEKSDLKGFDVVVRSLEMFAKEQSSQG